MGRKIKLIWDFRGQETLKIAEHHCKHLDEFTLSEKLFFYEINSEALNEFYSIAYLIVKEEDMPIFRDALKPHRAVVAN